MAITIKSIPVLKDKVALRFEEEAQFALEKRASIDFRKHVEVYSQIVKKSKAKK